VAWLSKSPDDDDDRRLIACTKRIDRSSDRFMTLKVAALTTKGKRGYALGYGRIDRYSFAKEYIGSAWIARRPSWHI